MSADPFDGWRAFDQAARTYMNAASQVSGQGAAQQFSDFLREQFSNYSQPWGNPQTTHPWSVAGVAPFFTAPLASGAAGSGTAGGTPAFGPTREHQERAQRMADAMQRMDAAQRRLQRLWADVLRDAAAHFVAQMGPTPSTSTPEALRKMYDRWIDCAEEAYAGVAHGDPYCQAQADFANAAAQWRLEQQANIEQWCRFLDLPTRSELNSLIRRLRAVEEQVRPKAAQAPRRAPSRGKAPAKSAKTRNSRKKRA